MALPPVLTTTAVNEDRPPELINTVIPHIANATAFYDAFLHWFKHFNCQVDVL